MQLRETRSVVRRFEFLDHGLEHPDFFQGCGVAFTNFDLCFTGTGASPYEAAHEALELASHDYRWNELMDEAETWIENHMGKTLDAFEPIPEDSDATYHVSIRIGIAAA